MYRHNMSLLTHKNTKNTDKETDTPNRRRTRTQYEK